MEEQAGANEAMFPHRCQVHAQIDRILASPKFRASARLTSLLAYLCRRRLETPSGTIKAYDIAVDVLGLGADFDDHLNPIVRTNATRLRHALEGYYSSDARNDPVVVVLPRGTYLPEFQYNKVDTAPAGIGNAARIMHSGRRQAISGALRYRARLRLAGASIAVAALVGVAALGCSITGQGLAPDLAGNPRLLVQPLSIYSDDQELAFLAPGLTEALIDRLSRFKEIAVMREPAPEHRAAAQAATPMDYTIEGGISADDVRLRVNIRLVQTATARILWSQQYVRHRSEPELFAMQEDISSSVAAEIAQAGGLIHSLQTGPSTSADIPAGTTYDCFLRYYAYRSSLIADDRKMVTACLLRAVALNAHDATSWSMLALTYRDDIRFGKDPAADFSQTLAGAAEAAHRAVRLAPHDPRALQALMAVRALEGRMDDAARAGARALAVNPNDSDLAAEYGFVLCVSGNWAGGHDVLERALNLDPNLTPYYGAILAASSYMVGEAERALVEVNRYPAPNYPLYYGIKAIILAELDMTTEAADAIHKLNERYPQFAANPSAELERRNIRAVDINRFIEGLRKAGLPV